MVLANPIHTPYFGMYSSGQPYMGGMLPLQPHFSYHVASPAGNVCRAHPQTKVLRTNFSHIMSLLPPRCLSCEPLTSSRPCDEASQYRSAPEVAETRF